MVPPAPGDVKTSDLQELSDAPFLEEARAEPIRTSSAAEVESKSMYSTLQLRRVCANLPIHQR